MKTTIFQPKDKFLSINVYKFPLGNCGGVTDHVQSIYIPCSEGPYTFENIESRNETHLIFIEEQRGENYFALKPITNEPGMLGPMSGGNLAYSSDSRCKKVYHIHDRFETPEQNRVLSR